MFNSLSLGLKYCLLRAIIMPEPPIRHHHGKSEQKEENSEASTEQKAQMEQAYQ